MCPEHQRLYEGWLDYHEPWRGKCWRCWGYDSHTGRICRMCQDNLAAHRQRMRDLRNQQLDMIREACRAHTQPTR